MKLNSAYLIKRVTAYAQQKGARINARAPFTHLQFIKRQDKSWIVRKLGAEYLKIGKKLLKTMEGA